MKELNFSFNAPITEGLSLNDTFTIKGVAINATITGNNHKFLEEELRPAASSLTGVPLLVDHDNRVESIKGRVKTGVYDEENKRVLFEANVVNKDMIEMIKNNLINSVSVGATVTSVEEEEGVLIPRGIKFKELSLVAVPADSNATFNYALSEAYKLQKIEDIPIAICETERRLNMEEQIREKDDKELSELKVKLEVAEKVLSEYKAKERKALEEKYNKMCESKKVSALDVSKMDENVLNLLISQLESIKVEEKVVVVQETKVEEKVAGKYRIVEGTGSLRGGSFTVEF